MHNLITRGWYLGDTCTSKNDDEDTTDGTNTNNDGTNMTDGDSNSNDHTDNTDQSHDNTNGNDNNTDTSDQSSNDNNGEGNGVDVSGQQGDNTNDGQNNQDSSNQSNNTNGKWIDFCKLPLEDLELEFTNGIEIKRDLERGIWARGTGAFFERVVKFPKYQWKRDDELPFSFVFTVRGQNPSFLFGIGSPDIDVNNLGHQALFSGETQLFYDNGRFNRFFGGSGVRNWAQNTNANIKFEDDKFYKVVFEKSGKVGSKINIYQVTKLDFDTPLEHLGVYTVEGNPADSELLIPYWNAVNIPDVFITAVKIGIPLPS